MINLFKRKNKSDTVTVVIDRYEYKYNATLKCKPWGWSMAPYFQLRVEGGSSIPSPPSSDYELTNTQSLTIAREEIKELSKKCMDNPQQFLMLLYYRGLENDYNQKVTTQKTKKEVEMDAILQEILK
jgi:hypothetical protein